MSITTTSSSLSGSRVGGSCTPTYLLLLSVRAPQFGTLKRGDHEADTHAVVGIPLHMRTRTNATTLLREFLTNSAHPRTDSAAFDLSPPTDWPYTEALDDMLYK